METKKEVSRPYVLHIRNNTYEFIKKFSINNVKQAMQTNGYDNRVWIGNVLQGVDFAEWLGLISTQKIRIGRFRMGAHHPYQKYRDVQLDLGITPLRKGADGHIISGGTLVTFKALNQYICEAVEKESDFTIGDFDGETWDIEIDLMPEIDLTLYLWPAEIENKKLEKPEAYLNQTINFSTAEPPKTQFITETSKSKSSKKN